MKLITTKDYLLLIDEEVKIKNGDYMLGGADDESLNEIWVMLNHYVSDEDKKIIAYRKLNEEAKELNLPLLPNSFEKHINVEKLAQTSWEKNREEKGHYSKKDINEKILMAGGYITGFQEGYKANTKQFSLEDMISFGKKCFYKGFEKREKDDANNFTAWREEGNELIQSLSTQQLPKEFIPDTVTIDGRAILHVEINSRNKKELVGEYKY